MLLKAFAKEGNEQEKVRKISSEKVVIDSGVLGCLLDREGVGGAGLCRGFAESWCCVGVRSCSAWFNGVVAVLWLWAVAEPASGWLLLSWICYGGATARGR